MCQGPLQGGDAQQADRPFAEAAKGSGVPSYSIQGANVGLMHSM